MAIAGVVASIATTPLGAALINVHVYRHGANSDTRIMGTLTAQSVSDSRQSLEFPLPAESISLPSGDWFLSVHIEGDWGEQRLVSVRDVPQTAELHTYPLALLTARVALPSGKEPHELQAYFHRVSIENLSSPAEGSVTCQVAKGMANCQLPTGDLDLAFRIPGYVSRYRWNASLKPRTTFDAGLLRFVEGSTLSGRVEIVGRRPDPSNARLDLVTVVVQPAAVPGANEEQRHRAEAARLIAHPNKRGFFAVELPPGQFSIQASSKDLISDTVIADVSAGHESLLRHPLVLEAKRAVTVRVHPPLDPWLKPWTIELAKIDDTGFLLSERALKTSPDGSCYFNDVLPGSYRLRVARSAEQSWASQQLEVSGDSTLDIRVKALRVTGTIRLGSRPLAATAMVRSSKTGAAAVLHSKADGTFLAALPAPEHDTWDEIEVRAESPILKRTLQNVALHRRDDGTAELNLELPSRTIIGMVVDELGRIAAPAMVDVLLPDGSLQQVDSPDGSFTVNGLDPGRYRLRAAAGERESIDLQDVVVTDDEAATVDALLPVVPVTHLHGVIQAFDGPVMGAALYATKPGDRTRPIILTRVDPEGRFDIRFPAATSEVVVAINAPGFAFRFTKTQLDSNDQNFAVEQNGGALSIDAPAVKSGLRPYLMHNGAALSAVAIGFVAGASFQANLSERVRFQIPNTEPGIYSLCWVADGPSTTKEIPPCVTGALAPHGTLTLSQ
jgi:hypothetical protein